MPNLPPFWSQVGSQNLKKSLNMPIQDASIFCLHFGIDFYAIWAPSWDPSCGHVGLLWPTKRTQDPPKKQNKRSWASWRSQDRCFINFDGCLVYFWSIWDWFFIDFLQENGVAKWGDHFVDKLSSQHNLIQDKPIHKHSSNLAPCGKASAYQIPGVDKALIKP